MMKSAFRWGLPLIILAFLLWGSLFLYYPIEIRPLAALQAFLPDGDEIAKITVTDLRLPRALVGMIFAKEKVAKKATRTRRSKKSAAAEAILDMGSASVV